MACLSVCRSVWKVYCGKMADWIWMSFGVVNWVGRVTGWRPHPQGEREVSGVFVPIGLNDVFECIFKTEVYSTRA